MLGSTVVQTGQGVWGHPLCEADQKLLMMQYLTVPEEGSEADL